MEKSFKSGFEHLYNDRSIANTGEIKCDGCEYPFQEHDLIIGKKGDKFIKVCDNCLNSKTIVRCHKCDNYMFYQEKYCCDNCCPEIKFNFIIGKPYFTTITIPIPKGKKYGLISDYFHEYIAERLNISPYSVYIVGYRGEYKSNLMYCPIELKDGYELQVKILDQCFSNNLTGDVSTSLPCILL